ncbi:MAG: ATP-binding protein [Pseudotabrizicola sp.]|uniref:ATP-binding protein n=1 Tax=Pseudotabrizicola sp. TaxID=2939647 RepID=UPI00272F1615|nr:ATP-binding protein [Pseudotabrizicola sp.]MDP2081968.1 ATP-binding protein [Pseudotabrizicola sp.]MDZ7575016.1 ATP-binding protein [Pseudotabrizicola sp.]
MRWPRSLQSRLALSLGVLLTLLWVAAAWGTSVALRHEMDEAFDSALQETAQRLLPLAVLDVLGRDEDDTPQRLATIRDHDEFFTYIVRDARGQMLLQSHAAEAAVFPPYDGVGYHQTATHRLYTEAALQGSIRITVAEPVEHRSTVARNIQIGLALPLLVVIPAALLAILLAVRTSLRPLREFRKTLGGRDAHDLSPVPTKGLPWEIAPVAATLNDVFERLKASFDAERSFAANAGHELRTPLAGAIAQAQRLRSETSEPGTVQRATDIEATLKRLTRVAERLMQLARAEGGQLRLDHASDLRLVARLVVADIDRTAAPDRIRLTLPEQPVMSDLDPDAFGILCRNLIENALRHGQEGSAVEVELTADGTLIIANAGPVVPAQTLARLTARFERAGASAEGSGLGLAIVAAIADRLGSELILKSPRTGQASGFEARLKLSV